MPGLPDLPPRPLRYGEPVCIFAPHMTRRLTLIDDRRIDRPPASRLRIEALESTRAVLSRTTRKWWGFVTRTPRPDAWGDLVEVEPPPQSGACVGFDSKICHHACPNGLFLILALLKSYGLHGFNCERD